MTQRNNLPAKSVNPASLSKRMLIGAAIGLTLIGIFLYGVNDAKPEWGKFWMIRPLLMVPFAGAMGGLFYYIMDHISYKGGWRKILAIVVSVIGFIIALWLGAVLGLDGTLWD
ncbi:hypothetical protein [Pedobacter sp.]|uniref:hypothetical protein n=1 Tax=Pedobacter sp. TaxID=1411316 RepID=UPI003BAC3CA5